MPRALIAGCVLAAVLLAGSVAAPAGPGKEARAMATPAFTLVSSAFAPGETVPKVHTCDGADTSPPLVWHGVPAGTVSLALLCDDPDAPAGTWVHWVVYDLAPGTSELAAAVAKADTLAGGARQGVNDFRKVGYGGPCPPRGHGAHRYFFRLLALDRKLGLAPRATLKQVLAAAEGHILGRAELMGRYGR